MKTSQLLLTAVLGLGLSSVASAQITGPGNGFGAPGSINSTGSTAPGSPATLGTPGTTVQGQTGVTSTTLPGSPAPVGTVPSTIYAPGTAPAGTPGTLRGNQPVSNTPGTAPTRTIHRAPTGARTNSTNTTVRP